ncbi:MAG TPA: hypothetical protein VK463_18120 [Desulfomonilaceae bacterium]|nr:hypothetical protein [Desulfomonilaceae bacterium]
MNPAAQKKKAPDPSATRTDKDWVMIVLGVLLAVLFLAGGYASLSQGEKAAVHKMKGPVKDPKSMGMFDRRSDLLRSDARLRGAASMDNTKLLLTAA